MKCTKCGSEFEEEIWKTPALDYEEYICSNEKCCAVHTINIDTKLDDDGERTGDIERDWDTLEFDYIWEQGIKKCCDDDSKIICIHDYDNHKVRFLKCPMGIEDCSEKIEQFIGKTYRVGNIEWMLVDRRSIMIQDIINTQ